MFASLFLNELFPQNLFQREGKGNSAVFLMR